tara:strand:- start:3317 stop:5089 length:1773 start_codon:yes stop_codon:yes gene_type:complete
MYNRSIYKGLTGAEAIYKSFSEKKIRHVFGYTGGAILSLTNQFHESNNYSNIQYIKNVNELCGGHAAEGYAKVSNKPGIILTTSGPGVTNLITPLQNAYSDGTALIAISGQVPTSVIGQGAFQECPSLELTKPCTKWNFRPQSVNEIPNMMELAFNISLSGRKGPVFLDIPKEILSATITTPHSVHMKPIIEDSGMDYTDKINIPRFLRLLYKSKKPILYIGQGAIRSSKFVQQLIDTLNIPFTTTIHGMGIGNELHDNSLHMLGMHGSIYANTSIQQSDLIICIGARFDDRTTGQLDKYAPEARLASAENRGGIVHFDISKTQIGKVVTPDISFHGNCGNYIRRILPEIDRVLIKNKWTEWTDYTFKLKQNNPFKYEHKPNTIKAQDIIQYMDTFIGHTSPYITTGVGNHQMYAAQHFRWKKPGRMITSGSLGTMGFGLPSAIGVQLHKPDETVILIDGDGSFGMTFNDLSTVMEYNLPIKMFIMNDSRQQMVHTWQKLFFNENFISTDNFNPNFNTLASAFGIKNITINNIKNLRTKFKKIFNHKGPVLVNCIIEPDMCMPLVSPGKGLDEMITYDSQNITITGEAPN